jgi:5-hydroxyisourate hydrolase
MAGRLTTHVLDTAHGRPAEGMAISLERITAAGQETIARVRTNADGRTDRPMLADGDFRPGVYELRFETGAYWTAQGVALPDPPFLDVVPVRFAVADPEAHYHVPLLCSPWAYSTYRGS